MITPLPASLFSGQRSPQWLYDQVMAALEPELTTEGLKTLATKYKNETAKQAKARAARYAKIFAEFDRILGEVLAMFEYDALEARQMAVACAAAAESAEREAADRMLA